MPERNLYAGSNDSGRIDPDTAIKPGKQYLFNIIFKNVMDYILIERAIFNGIVARITEYSAKIELAMGNLGCHPLGNWVDNERAQRLLHRGKRSLQSLRSSGKIGYTIIDGKVMYPLKEIERFISQSYRKDGG